MVNDTLVLPLDPVALLKNMLLRRFGCDRRRFELCPVLLKCIPIVHTPLLLMGLFISGIS